MSSPTPFHQTTGVKQVFRALNNRNYRLFFFGQGVSLIGTWMQTIALGWLVYRITHSPFLLGMVGFAGQLPMLFLTPFAGVLSDRWQRRRVLVVTQCLAMLQALALACLTLTGLIQVWHLMVRVAAKERQETHPDCQQQHDSIYFTLRALFRSGIYFQIES